MHWDVLVIIAATAVIQSLFGVGVLLFGTTILLVLDYPFVMALTLLLPVSLAINLLQVGTHDPLIDRGFYRRVLLLAVPCIVGSLLLVGKANLTLGVAVGVLVVVAALRDFVPWLRRPLDSAVRRERTTIVVMGLVHGLTNVGGSILTALVHGKNYEKDVSRVTVAACYGTFAAFQLLTIACSQAYWPVRPSLSLISFIVGVVVFLLTDRLLYPRIVPERYRTLFAVFLFSSGIVLIAKSILTL